MSAGGILLLIGGLLACGGSGGTAVPDSPPDVVTTSTSPEPDPGGTTPTVTPSGTTDDTAAWTERADAICGEAVSGYRSAKSSVTDPIARTEMSADMLEDAARVLGERQAPAGDAEELLAGIRDLSAAYHQVASAWDSGTQTEQEQADQATSRATDRIRQAAGRLGAPACAALPHDM